MKPSRLLFLLLVPVALEAQVPSSLSLGVGFRKFGTRLERSGASYQYANSMEFELRGEKAISRRWGIMAAVMAAPFSGQKADEEDVSVAGDISAFGAEAALSFRFKPDAPIYFYGGGAFMRFSGYADPGEPDDSVNEPGGVIGLGFDKSASGRYNLRVQIGVHLMKPADGQPRLDTEGNQIPSPNTATSIARDWSFTVALRRSSRSE